MRIREIMRRTPWVIDGIDSLHTAYQLMRRHAIRHLPVLREGKLIGLLSEHDILEFRAELGGADDWTRAAASSAMRRSPQTAGPDDSLTELVGRFAADKLEAVPVVERGKLVGIVTVTDLLAAEVQLAMAPSPPRPTAADAMTPGPFTARPDEDLLAAATRMVTHGIRHLPVVDEREVVIGILSDRDVCTHVGDPSNFVIARDATALRVRDAMTAAPITVGPDRPLVELARVFEDRQIGAIPVVDQDGELVGIVSYVDALRVLSRSEVVHHTA
jgi:acetoin utilization protein AcuB